MSTPTEPEAPDQGYDLPPEDEDELLRRCEDAMREDAELIPHEALFTDLTDRQGAGRGLRSCWARSLT